MNFAHYPSKHHPTHHHAKVHGTYVHKANILLRGCVNLRADLSTMNTHKDILNMIQQCISIQRAKYSLNDDVVGNSTIELWYG